MLFLPVIVASLGLADAAIVTVTNHVHESAIISVEGILYVENGQTKTTYVTQGGAQPTPAVSNQISTSVVAVAAPSGSQASFSTPPSGSEVVTVITETAGSASGSATPSSTSSPPPSSGSSAPPSSSSAAPSSTSSPASSGSSAPPSSSSAPASSSSAPSPTHSVKTTTLAPSSSSSFSSPSPSPSPSSSATSSSSPSTPSSSSSSGSGSDFQKTMVDGHNGKRAKHESTGSLEWDDKLAEYAQNYADNYDCSGNLVHSHGPYGENLAVGYDDQGTIDAWYNEIKQYSFADPVFSESTGHFTQLIWKSTTKVGCGSKQCGGSVGKYVICSYDPAGNVIGDFVENVMPLL